MATLLIKNVRVLGAPAASLEPMDVFVSGQKISAVGNFPDKKAGTVLDGQGAYLSPGFIDVHNESDHYLALWERPAQEYFLRQGITTIISGHGGSSLAPLLYGTLESFRKWTAISRLNVNWHSMREFLNHFIRQPLGVNFATLVGHATVRRAIIGEEIRPLTKNELLVMKEILCRALREGGAGISVGLDYAHGAAVSAAELKFLANIVREHHRVLAIRPRRTETEPAGDAAEIIRLSQNTDATTLLSSFLPRQNTEEKYERVLKQIDNLPQKTNLYLDLPPPGVMPLKELYTFLPLWAQKDSLEKMARVIADEWLSPKIIQDMAPVRADIFFVAHAPGNIFLTGRSLQDIAMSHNSADCRRALMQLMRLTKLRAVIYYNNLNSSLLSATLNRPYALLGSYAADCSELCLPAASQQTPGFPSFLSLFAGKESLPAAIHKVTALPATVFNLVDRGVIREGYAADLVVFSLPAASATAHVRHVVVNGTPAIIDGQLQKKRSGQVLFTA